MPPKASETKQPSKNVLIQLDLTTSESIEAIQQSSLKNDGTRSQDQLRAEFSPFLQDLPSKMSHLLTTKADHFYVAGQKCEWQYLMAALIATGDNRNLERLLAVRDNHGEEIYTVEACLEFVRSGRAPMIDGNIAKLFPLSVMNHMNVVDSADNSPQSVQNRRQEAAFEVIKRTMTNPTENYLSRLINFAIPLEGSIIDRLDLIAKYLELPDINLESFKSQPEAKLSVLDDFMIQIFTQKGKIKLNGMTLAEVEKSQEIITTMKKLGCSFNFELFTGNMSLEDSANYQAILSGTAVSKSKEEEEKDRRSAIKPIREAKTSTDKTVEPKETSKETKKQEAAKVLAELLPNTIKPSTKPKAEKPKEEKSKTDKSKRTSLTVSVSPTKPSVSKGDKVPSSKPSSFAFEGAKKTLKKGEDSNKGLQELLYKTLEGANPKAKLTEAEILKIVSECLEDGSPKSISNTRDPNSGDTALHLALKNDRDDEIVRQLLVRHDFAEELKEIAKQLAKAGEKPEKINAIWKNSTLNLMIENGYPTHLFGLALEKLKSELQKNNNEGEEKSPKAGNNEILPNLLRSLVNSAAQYNCLGYIAELVNNFDDINLDTAKNDPKRTVKTMIADVAEIRKQAAFNSTSTLENIQAAERLAQKYNLTPLKEALSERARSFDQQIKQFNDRKSLLIQGCKIAELNSFLLEYKIKLGTDDLITLIGNISSIGVPADKIIAVQNFKTMLAEVADINAPNADGNTALFIALDKGQKAIIRALLENNAISSLYIKNKQGLSPHIKLLHSTIQGLGDEPRNLCFCHAIINNDIATIELLNAKNNLGISDVIDLIEKIAIESTPERRKEIQSQEISNKIIAILLPDNYQVTALDINAAFRSNNPRLCRALLDRAILNPNFDFSKINSNYSNHPHVKDAILIHRALSQKINNLAINNDNFDTPLHVAIKNHYHKSLEKLLRHPQSRELLNAANLQGETPISLAPGIESDLGKVEQVAEVKEADNAEKLARIAVLKSEIPILEKEHKQSHDIHNKAIEEKNKKTNDEVTNQKAVINRIAAEISANEAEIKTIISAIARNEKSKNLAKINEKLKAYNKEQKEKASKEKKTGIEDISLEDYLVIIINSFDPQSSETGDKEKIRKLQKNFLGALGLTKEEVKALQKANESKSEEKAKKTEDTTSSPTPPSAGLINFRKLIGSKELREKKDKETQAEILKLKALEVKYGKELKYLNDEDERTDKELKEKLNKLETAQKELKDLEDILKTAKGYEQTIIDEKERRHKQKLEDLDKRLTGIITKEIEASYKETKEKSEALEVLKLKASQLENAPIQHNSDVKGPLELAKKNLERTNSDELMKKKLALQAELKNSKDPKAKKNPDRTEKVVEEEFDVVVKKMQENAKQIRELDKKIMGAYEENEALKAEKAQANNDLLAKRQELATEKAEFIKQEVEKAKNALVPEKTIENLEKALKVKEDAKEEVVFQGLRTRNNGHYAWFSDDILLANRAFDHTQGLHTENGILVNQDGNPFRNRDKQIVIEFPAFAVAEASVFHEIVQAQMKSLDQLILKYKESKEESKEQKEAEAASKFPFKILIPYRIGAWHWNVIEIIVTDPNTASCSKYNTNGLKEKLDDAAFNVIKKEFAGFNITNNQEQETYYARAGQRNVNCGMVAALIMHDLKTGARDQTFYNSYVREGFTDQQLRHDVFRDVYRNLDVLDREQFCPAAEESKFAESTGVSHITKERQEILENLKNISAAIPKDLFSSIQKILLISDQKKAGEYIKAAIEKSDMDVSNKAALNKAIFHNDKFRDIKALNIFFRAKESENKVGSKVYKADDDIYLTSHVADSFLEIVSKACKADPNYILSQDYTNLKKEISEQIPEAEIANFVEAVKWVEEVRYKKEEKKEADPSSHEKAVIKAIQESANPLASIYEQAPTITAIGDDGKNVLHIIAINGGDVSKYVVDPSFDGVVNNPDKYGMRPLDYAIMHGNERMVNSLLANGIRSELANSMEIPTDAARIVEFMRQKDPNIPPLCHAIMANDLGMFNLLLDNGANVNSQGADDKQPLDYAEEKHSAIFNGVKKLIITPQDAKAAQTINKIIARSLLNQGATSNMIDAGNNAYIASIPVQAKLPERDAKTPPSSPESSHNSRQEPSANAKSVTASNLLSPNDKSTDKSPRGAGNSGRD